jgi:hypothetical protein
VLQGGAGGGCGGVERATPIVGALDGPSQGVNGGELEGKEYGNSRCGGTLDRLGCEVSEGHAAAVARWWLIDWRLGAL